MGKDVATGAGALIGGALGGIQSGGQTQTQSSAPWGPQQPYITGAYGTAQNVYNQEAGVQLPGAYVAAPRQQQDNSAQTLGSYGLGSDLSVYDPIYNQSQNLLSQGGTYVHNAQALANNGIGAQSPYTAMLGNYASTGELGGSGLSAALSSAAMGGLGSLGASSGLAGQIGALGLNPANGTNAALAGAQQAISSPTLSAAIDGANSSLNRDLTENTLPQIRAAAGANGNANSSREGALEATATTNTQQQMLANADQLTNNAFNTGYQGGLSSYESGLSNANSAAGNLNYGGMIAGNLGANVSGQQLGALENAGNQQLGYQVDNTNALLNANSQLGNSYGLGVNSANAYSQGQLGSINAALTGGNALQSQDQSRVNNGLEQYQYATQMPSNILNNYWGIVGQKQGGDATTTSTPNNGGLGGALSGLIGGAANGYGLWKNYGDDSPTNTIGGYDPAASGAFSGFGSPSNPWAAGMI